MFLFSSTSDSSTSAVGAGVDRVKSAIKSAADATGAGFSYLLKTAEKESSLKPDAQASTSSARGLYQFIDQTWLGMVKEEGPKHGLAKYAEAINRSNDGRYAVSDPAARKDILSLRDDPSISAIMAGAFTNRNANDLRGTIGRNPTEGELYMAHFLGAQGAGRLITMAKDNPSGAAANSFPDAAAANKRIFFDKEGSPRSAGEVYRMIAQGHDDSIVPVQAASAQPSVDPGGDNFSDRWAPFAKVKPQADRPFHSIFASNNAQPINSMIQKTWGTLGSNVPPQVMAQLEQTANASGGPFVPLTSPSWVKPVTASAQNGVSAPLDLTAFAKNRR